MQPEQEKLANLENVLQPPQHEDLGGQSQVYGDVGHSAVAPSVEREPFDIPDSINASTKVVGRHDLGANLSGQWAQMESASQPPQNPNDPNKL